MRISTSVLVAGLCLGFALPAGAQTIGVLQSAETMDKGVYKLMIAPLMDFGKDGAKDEFGLGLRGGYGFTDRFDAEAKVGFFKNGTYLGLDGEYWIVKSEVKDSGLDVSLTGGLHWVLGKKNYLDTMGFDITPQVSGHVSPRVELCGALDASFNSIKDAPPGADDTYTALHLVPGVEYSISSMADLVAEFGLGLNDNSDSYAGIGIAFYLR